MGRSSRPSAGPESKAAVPTWSALTLANAKTVSMPKELRQAVEAQQRVLWRDFLATIDSPDRKATLRSLYKMNKRRALQIAGEALESARRDAEHETPSALRIDQQRVLNDSNNALTEADESVSNVSQNMSNSGRLSKEQAAFSFPALNTEEELERIANRAAEIEEKAAAYHALGLSDAEVRVAGYAELAERYTSLAKNIGLHAISQGNLSQIKMAKAIGTHQLTVGRWVKEARESQRDL